MKILVMKFGGASVESTQSFDRVASIIQKKSMEYDGIVVVVSAMLKMTDHLINLAYKVHPEPPQREYDMLISVGERVSTSLLAMALNLKGIKAISFTGSQSGIITSLEHTSARIIDVRPVRLWEHLQNKEVVIVAGFQGVSEKKDITTLGRGGSDTSAVALAIALNAERVEFYKDVEGIYDKDPHLSKNAQLKENLTYDEALSINTFKKFILHPRSLLLAKKNNIPLNVLSFKNNSSPGTLVSDNLSIKQTQKFFENELASVNM